MGVVIKFTRRGRRARRPVGTVSTAAANVRGVVVILTVVRNERVLKTPPPPCCRRR